MTESNVIALNCQPRADRRTISGYVMLLVLLLVEPSSRSGGIELANDRPSTAAYRP
jgi:hypothetical protein